MTPASSNSEETHNTLKFAHRSKRVEIKASQNKVNLIFTYYVKLLFIKNPSPDVASSFTASLTLPFSLMTVDYG